MDGHETARAAQLRAALRPGTRVAVDLVARWDTTAPAHGIVVGWREWADGDRLQMRCDVLGDDGTERVYAAGDLRPVVVGASAPAWVAAVALARVAERGGRVVVAYDPEQIASERWWVAVQVPPVAGGMVGPTLGIAAERAMAERARAIASNEAEAAGLAPAPPAALRPAAETEAPDGDA